AAVLARRHPVLGDVLYIGPLQYGRIRESYDGLVAGTEVCEHAYSKILRKIRLYGECRSRTAVGLGVNTAPERLAATVPLLHEPGNQFRNLADLLRLTFRDDLHSADRIAGLDHRDLVTGDGVMETVNRGHSAQVSGRRDLITSRYG